MPRPSLAPALPWWPDDDANLDNDLDLDLAPRISVTLTPTQRAALITGLHRALRDEGCDNTLRTARRWADAWARLHRELRTTVGPATARCCSTSSRRGGPSGRRWAGSADPARGPDDDVAAAVAEIGRVDPAEFLARHWTPNCPLCGCREPFGRVPGSRATGPRTGRPLHRAATADLPLGHLALVPVSRPADVLTAEGWPGPCNYGTDLAGLSACCGAGRTGSGRWWLRLDRATLWLSFAALPESPDAARAVAAEHFAFGRDVDQEDPRPLRTYAAGLMGKRTRRFGWD